MDAVVAEKLAHSLARLAVTGERPTMEKSALTVAEALANPYVRNGLIGAGAGGVVGLLQPKRKLRDVLTYGLLGATAGTGLAGIQDLTRSSAGSKSDAAEKPAPAKITAEEREKLLPLGQNGVSPAAAGNAVGGLAAAGVGYHGYRQTVRNQVSKNRTTGLDGGLLNLYNAAHDSNSRLSPASKAVGENIVRQNGDFLYKTPKVNSSGKTVMVPRELPPRSGNVFYGPLKPADVALHDDIGRALTEAHKVTKPTWGQRGRGLGVGALRALLMYAGGRFAGESGANVYNLRNHPQAFAPAQDQPETAAPATK